MDDISPHCRIQTLVVVVVVRSSGARPITNLTNPRLQLHVLPRRRHHEDWSFQHGGKHELGVGRLTPWLGPKLLLPALACHCLWPEGCAQTNSDAGDGHEGGRGERAKAAPGALRSEFVN